MHRRRSSPECSLPVSLLAAVAVMAGLPGCPAKNPTPSPATRPAKPPAGPGAARPEGSPAYGAELTPWVERPPIAAARLRRLIKRLVPLHERLGKPQPGDWLARHEEPGQSFESYSKSSPSTPTARRFVLSVQPIGPFSAPQARVLQLTADFLSRFFCLPVKVAPRLPLSAIPARARRRHPRWKVKQILSTYVLDELLRPRLPADAVASLGLTATDLWPGRGWNFVFGQASLRHRVGVWSMARNGDPSAGPTAFRLFLLRTLKTATHETGHMLSIRHCTRYACNMCGSNSRAESDRRPLALCPEDLAKLSWATRCEPRARYQRLLAFCRKNGLQTEAVAYTKLLARTRATAKAGPAGAKEGRP